MIDQHERTISKINKDIKKAHQVIALAEALIAQGSQQHERLLHDTRERLNRLKSEQADAMEVQPG